MIREATLADLELVCSFIERDSGKANEAGIQAVLHDPMSIILIEDESAAMFVWRGPGVFEVHLALATRARHAMGQLYRMFCNVRRLRGDVRLFWAAVPWDNSAQSRKVRWFARKMGWDSEGRANTADGFVELFTGE